MSNGPFDIQECTCDPTLTKPIPIFFLRMHQVRTSPGRTNVCAPLANFPQRITSFFSKLESPLHPIQTNVHPSHHHGQALVQVGVPDLAVNPNAVLTTASPETLDSDRVAAILEPKVWHHATSKWTVPPAPFDKCSRRARSQGSSVDSPSATVATA
jgi:hypothetical protein